MKLKFLLNVLSCTLYHVLVLTGFAVLSGFVVLGILSCLSGTPLPGAMPWPLVAFFCLSIGLPSLALGRDAALKLNND